MDESTRANRRQPEARLLIALLGGQIFELPFPIFKMALADTVAAMPSAVPHPCCSSFPSINKPSHRTSNIGLGVVLAVGEDGAETTNQEVGQLEKLAIIVVPVVGMAMIAGAVINDVASGNHAIRTQPLSQPA